MKNYIHPIVKAAKKAGITEETARKIVVYEHELSQLYPKKSLCEMQIDFTKESRQVTEKIAKALKVSNDAVIGTLLIKYLEEDKNGFDLKGK